MSSTSCLNLFLKYRFAILKFILVVLMLYNLVMCALQNQELAERVQQLETEKRVWSKNQQVAIVSVDKIIAEKSNISEKKEVQIEYSQRKYYPFIYNLANKCNDDDGEPEPIYLLIVIKSITSQFDRRQSIRTTWGNENYIPGVKMKRIFLLARSSDAKKEALLAEEASEYGDIIQGDFVDSFRNLTIKDVMFLRWMITYCSQVKYIFKGDDDVFVNMRNIVDYLMSLSNDESRDLFVGSVLYPSPRITDIKSKYYVSSNLYNEKYYPPYVSGGGFIMSSLIAKKIFEVIKVTPIIPIDDAFMGICLQKLGLKPRNHRGFKSWGVNRRQDVCVYREIMTLHKLSSSEMLTMWKKLHEASFDECAQLVTADVAVTTKT